MAAAADLARVSYRQYRLLSVSWVMLTISASMLMARAGIALWPVLGLLPLGVAGFVVVRMVQHRRALPRLEAVADDDALRALVADHTTGQRFRGSADRRPPGTGARTPTTSAGYDARSSGEVRGSRRGADPAHGRVDES